MTCLLYNARWHVGAGRKQNLVYYSWELVFSVSRFNQNFVVTGNAFKLVKIFESWSLRRWKRVGSKQPSECDRKRINATYEIFSLFSFHYINEVIQTPYNVISSVTQSFFKYVCSLYLTTYRFEKMLADDLTPW